MKLDSLVASPLFRGLKHEEIETLLSCLGAKYKCYSKGERIFRAGDVITVVGLVVSGSVVIENNDAWGNTAVLDRVGPSCIFAEAYACAPGAPLMVDVMANEKTEVVFLQVKRVLRVCAQGCEYHHHLIQNLLGIAAQRNLALSRKIMHTTPKTIRDRLLSYLSERSLAENSRKFVIPFNRQQLAEYLNVDRSALSNELGKMQRDGLIRVNKNEFELL